MPNRNKMKKIVLSVTLSALPFFCLASDWNYVGGSGKTFYTIDFATVAQSGPYKKAWFRTSYFEDQKTTTNPIKSYRSELALFYFDCKERRFTTTQTIKNEGISGDGDVVSTWNGPLSSAGFVDVAPDSIGDMMLRAACASQSEREKIKAENQETTKSITDLFSKVRAGLIK